MPKILTVARTIVSGYREDLMNTQAALHAVKQWVLSSGNCRRKGHKRALADRVVAGVRNCDVKYANICYLLFGRYVLTSLRGISAAELALSDIFLVGCID
ncbi:hypothetical protein WUBG_01042 [Wuchereria bancrofti]|uniref:Uncharacterized protein n=1 Tax=Wuchereria bancrofti TaxID=6293 RepID=J9BKS5_WUCBA|nr:hypothetical protein WUBG_01042 [Wuchereria bancrofti]